MDLSKFFNPKSVAVIGASTNPSKVGHAIVGNLIDSGYVKIGKVYPVNPKADEILGLKCYKSVTEIPDEIDLAVIVLPSRIVPAVVEECAKKGIKSIIVISAGFKEVGGEGAKLEKQIVELSKKYNLAIQGPNCLGVIDTYTPLNASFSDGTPIKGNIAFISQSGALCTAILDWALKEKVGFSKFISVGNKAVLDEIDFIEYLKNDPHSYVILNYVESIDDGQKFLEIMPQVTKKKPVVILKGGISEAGARAASSHTGALAGSTVAYKTAFKQTGVIMANNVSELFEYAHAFSNKVLPNGPRVAVVTNAGGPGILTTDAVISAGLKIASFSKQTIETLKQHLPPVANIYNPVDVIGDAKADRYKYAIDAVAQDPNVDSILVLLTPQAMTEPMETAKVIIEARKKYPEKPIFAVYMGGRELEESVNFLKDNNVPTFIFPESAVRALKALVDYKKYLDEPLSEVPNFDDIDKERVRRIIENVRKDNRVILLGHETAEIMDAYGIPSPLTKLATSEEEAVKFANKIGYPVVMKIVSPQILHKTDVGGVAVNVKTPEEVKKKFNEIMNNVTRLMPKSKIYGIQIYKMAPQGKEMIIGVSKDVQFGHLIMFGLGGIYVNFLKDVSFRLVPLTIREAREMIFETKAGTLLSGIRGEKPSDIKSIVDILLRINQLVRDFPEIVELDINPLFVYDEGKGSLALDVKITLSS
ncbi:MAG: acetate--CoA ligase [Candidatus Odinarchaeota archaeon]|nr:acetate--CoA ligase [Candidatus Odinarchaeota archaeon]